MSEWQYTLCSALIIISIPIVIAVIGEVIAIIKEKL